MRYQRLDLNLLTALRSLLTEKNVTRAGERLFVSQSAMSGILARLREYFDDPLIVPVGRRMERTPLGESLVDKVNDLILQIDATLGTKPEFEPATTRRHFRIVASDFALGVLLLDVLRDLAARAPGMTVEFRQPSRVCYQELESGDVDFVVAPEWHDLSGFSSCELFSDAYSAVVDRDHPQVRDALTLTQYLDLGHVSCVTVGPPMFETWFSKAHGPRRRVELSVPNFSMLPDLVVGTLRVATLHTRQALQACDRLPVRIARLDFDHPGFTQMLTWHTYRDHDPGLQWLRERITERARALPAAQHAPLSPRPPG